MWCIWAVVLCPLPGLGAVEPGYPPQTNQTTQLQGKEGGFLNETSPENQTDSKGVTPGPNGTRPTRRSWASITTPVSTLAESSTKSKSDPPVPRQRDSPSLTKYWIPPVVVVVLLIGLFLMYRRKKGRESLSRTVSINEYSSDSDTEGDFAAEKAEQRNPSLQGFKPIPEESEQTATEENETVLGAQVQPLPQAKRGSDGNF